MKIKRLHVKHVKGVREVDIHAKDVNEVAGPNGAGKSSVMDSIIFALRGKRFIDPKVLRDGESKGFINIETDDLVITRKFKEGSNPALIVKGKDGAKYGQTRLNDLFGSFTFDPLAFSRMAPKDQIKTMQELAGEEFCKNLRIKDIEIVDCMEERAAINRDLKRVGRIEEIEKVQEVDVIKITEQLQEIDEFNNKQRKAQIDEDMLKGRLMSTEEDVRELQEEIEKTKNLIAIIQHQLKELPKFKHLKDPEPIHKQLTEAGEINRRAQEYQNYLSKLDEQKKLSREALEHDEKVEQLRGDRKTLAATANLPIDGVSFTDEGLRINGIPFEQISSSEQIRVSVRIGMTINNELRIMLVKDGSLLDQNSFVELVGVAEKHDYQLWIETVGDGHGDAIHLEEGAIVEDTKTEKPAF